MHQRTNNVEIEGVVSESAFYSTLTSSLTNGAGSIQVQDGSQFHTIINGTQIGNLNPGYLKIGTEIIQYSAISTNGQVITVSTGGRGAGGTADVTHESGSVVECYNLDGIPLTQINKVHERIECPWIDSYMISTDFVATNGIRGGGTGVLLHRMSSLKH